MNADLRGLAPCPFCGNKDAPTTMRDGPDEWTVVCRSHQFVGGCGASIGWTTSECKAAQKWNTRTPAAPAQPDGVSK